MLAHKLTNSVYLTIFLIKNISVNYKKKLSRRKFVYCQACFEENKKHLMFFNLSFDILENQIHTFSSIFIMFTSAPFKHLLLVGQKGLKGTVVNMDCKYLNILYLKLCQQYI